MNDTDMYNENLKSIGALLKELRLNELMTIDEAAYCSGLHPNTVSRIEAGCNTSLLSLYKLTAIYDITPQEVIRLALE